MAKRMRTIDEEAKHCPPHPFYLFTESNLGILIREATDVIERAAEVADKRRVCGLYSYYEWVLFFRSQRVLKREIASRRVTFRRERLSFSYPRLRAKQCWRCSPVSTRRFKSITFDNDTAFAQHALLRTMRAMTTWFCDAYASWQKGGVENANGRLRHWLPRQIDIDKVSDEEIQDIVMTANLTPRKCMGFKTPLRAILKELGTDVQIRFA